MRALKAPRVKWLMTCMAPAAMLATTGCDTTADSAVLAIVDTSVSFVRDFILNVLAAVLL